METKPLSDYQLDALREIANMGCGAAATALSQLLNGRHINIEVTRSAILSFEEIEALLGPQKNNRIAVGVHLRGKFEGKLLLVYKDSEALDLAESLGGSAAIQKDFELSEIGRSVLMEVGNIVASSFLNAVGKVSGEILLPSVPSLLENNIKKIVSFLHNEDESALRDSTEKPFNMLVLETRLWTKDGPEFDGHLIIVPRIGSVGILLRALSLE